MKLIAQSIMKLIAQSIMKLMPTPRTTTNDNGNLGTKIATYLQISARVVLVVIFNAFSESLCKIPKETPAENQISNATVIHGVATKFF